MPSIRSSAMNDVPAFAVIERSAGELFRATDRAWIADEPPTRPADHEQAIAEAHHWSALVEGELVGFLLAERFGTALHICELAVALPFQRQGAGSALIAAAEAYAAAAAFMTVTLTTYRDLAWNAPFYARRGYREIPLAMMPGYLALLLQGEARNGHDPGLRCAMAKSLRPHPLPPAD